LLVVETHRRHVAEDNCLKAANVNPDFHSRRNTEHVNLIDQLHHWLCGVIAQVNGYVSKQTLAFSLVIRLSGQFLAMQPEWLTSLNRLLRVVVAFVKITTYGIRFGC
jgi:hypothetical protein